MKASPRAPLHRASDGEGCWGTVPASGTAPVEEAPSFGACCGFKPSCPQGGAGPPRFIFVSAFSLPTRGLLPVGFASILFQSCTRESVDGFSAGAIGVIVRGLADGYTCTCDNPNTLGAGTLRGLALDDPAVTCFVDSRIPVAFQERYQGGGVRGVEGAGDPPLREVRILDANSSRAVP